MSKKKSVLASAFQSSGKGNQDIRTPLALFKILDDQFKFSLDPCDSMEKPHWLGKCCFNMIHGHDGLKKRWWGKVFVNPPWNNIQPWIDKAERELKLNDTRFVVFLLPSRTETKWFHHLLESEHLMKHIFLKKRVHFDGQTDPYIVGISIFILWKGLKL